MRCIASDVAILRTDNVGARIVVFSHNLSLFSHVFDEDIVAGLQRWCLSCGVSLVVVVTLLLFHVGFLLQDGSWNGLGFWD